MNLDQIQQKIKAGNYAALTKEEREFLVDQKRTEKQILTQQGKRVKFGNIELVVPVLEWDESNAFEDKIADVVSKFNAFTVQDIEKLNVEEFINTIITLLRNDLLVLASAATQGKVTLDFVRENHATKNDVMKVIVESFKLNYSYLKNALNLANQLR